MGIGKESLNQNKISDSLDDLGPVDAVEPSEIEEKWQFFGFAILLGFFAIMTFINKIMKVKTINNSFES